MVPQALFSDGVLPVERARRSWVKMRNRRNLPQSTMTKLAELARVETPRRPGLLPVSVIIPVRNEAHNLARCLESFRDAGEVYVIDSQSTDETVEIARSYGAKVV